MALTLPQNMFENITITGAKGFVGKWLQKHLQEAGIPFTPFEGDLLDVGQTEFFFEKHPTDLVIHLVGTFNSNFDSLFEKNVLTTQNLLDVGIKKGVKKIIYTSTGAVYGEPVELESVETDPLQPNTLYGLTKKFAEDIIQYYHQTKGIEFIILRFPNVYGKGSKKGVLYNLLTDIRQNKRVRITGDGMQSRNFLHVYDACIAIEKALHYPKSDVFNISNPVKLTINDIVESLQKHFRFEKEFIPQDNFLKDLLLNTKKAKQLLNFEASVSSIEPYIAPSSVSFIG